MKKKVIIISSVIVVILLSLLIINIIKNKDSKEFYNLKGDKIKTITKVVGKRNLTSKKVSNNNGTITKTYTYNNIKDPYTDLSIYIKFLKNNSNFIVTKDYDLNNKKDSIQISRYSNKTNYIIIMDISYDKDSYTIKITKGKGKIKVS